jgi:hypothetical protein
MMRKLALASAAVLSLFGCGGGGGAAPPTPATLLPFLTAGGQLEVMDPTLATSSSNPAIVDTGLTPPVGNFARIWAFGEQTISGSTWSNNRTTRLVYNKGSATTGGQVFKLDLGGTGSRVTPMPVRISAISDACLLYGLGLGDSAHVDNSAMLVEGAGPDHSCSARADNTFTVIRLSSLSSDPGVAAPGRVITQTNDATGAITGFITIEGSTFSTLVHRDASLGSPSTLMSLANGTIDVSSLFSGSRVFIAVTPMGQTAPQLFAYDTGLSPALYTFTVYTGSPGAPLRTSAWDATNFYFTDGNQVRRIARTAMTVSSTLVGSVTSGETLSGQLFLDGASSRLVFTMANSSGQGGVFSLGTSASGATPTQLEVNPASASGAVFTVANGRAYINILTSTSGTVTSTTATAVGTDGSSLKTYANGFWAGEASKTTFNVDAGTFPPQFVLLATHASGNDTFSVFDENGNQGITLGTMNSTNPSKADAFEFGRYSLLEAQINRGSTSDYDVYFIDYQAPGSLAPMATTAGADDTSL